jgi:hypothetical protein
MKRNVIGETPMVDHCSSWIVGVCIAQSMHSSVKTPQELVR